MNLQELKDWIKESEFVDSDTTFDSNGNEDGFDIYLRDGKYYRICFYLDGFNKHHFCTKWVEGKGWSDDEYELQEVQRKSTITYYYE